MATAAAILALTSTAGCVVDAMYAVPVALDTAGTAIARALPVNEEKYIVRSHRMPPDEPALAAAPKRASAPAEAARPVPDLADARKAARQQAAPDLTTPTTAVTGLAPMPVLMDAAVARRTRI
jgi:hypothetical protein